MRENCSNFRHGYRTTTKNCAYYCPGKISNNLFFYIDIWILENLFFDITNYFLRKRKRISDINKYSSDIKKNISGVKEEFFYIRNTIFCYQKFTGFSDIKNLGFLKYKNDHFSDIKNSFSDIKKYFGFVISQILYFDIRIYLISENTSKFY